MTLEEQKKLLEGKKKVRKDKITLDEFFSTKNKLAINCKTQQQAKILFMVFKKLGKTWNDGDEYDPNEIRWSYYKGDTCYTNIGTFGAKKVFGDNVFDFDEVDFGKHLEEFHMLEKKRKRKEGKKITIEEFCLPNRKIAICCKTKKQAKTLFGIFNKLGRKMSLGVKYEFTFLLYYGKKTCYSNDGTLNFRSSYEQDNYEVYDFDEVDFGKYLSQDELIC